MERDQQGSDQQGRAFAELVLAIGQALVDSRLQAKTSSGQVDLAERPASYTCPRCERTSYHPEDVRNRYCGACHRFEDQP